MPAKFSGSQADSVTTSPSRRPGLEQMAQGVERLGERELLADEAGDEAPSPHLAARLEPAIDARQNRARRGARARAPGAHGA